LAIPIVRKTRPARQPQNLSENQKTIQNILQAPRYRRLEELRETLKPILLRRKRSEVAKQLPYRIDDVIRIEPTQEQAEICFSHMQTVAQILAKKFVTEMDLLRMQKSLLMARMACDSTFLIDQEEPRIQQQVGATE